MNSETLIKNLQRALERSKADDKTVSARGVSLAAGHSDKTLTAILKGKTLNPGILTLAPIATRLGVSLDELVGRTPAPSSVDLRKLRATVREIMTLQIERLASDHDLKPPLTEDEVGYLIEDTVDAVEYLYTNAPAPGPEGFATPDEAAAPVADATDDDLKRTAAEVIDFMAFRRKRGA